MSNAAPTSAPTVVARAEQATKYYGRGDMAVAALTGGVGAVERGG